MLFPESEAGLRQAQTPLDCDDAPSSASMRVLIVSACFPPYGWGGAEVAAEGIGEWLGRQGHEVAIYTDAAPPEAAAPGSSNEGKWYAPSRGGWMHRTHEHGRQSAPRKAIWHLLDHAPGRGKGNGQ